VNKLSVVVPTLNCLELLRDHVTTMREWWHLADEIIVVDSFSDDGCADYARREIDHPGLRVLSHPRGLYQSWNYGIAQTSGWWVYISTVGDGIKSDQIKRLVAAGEQLSADVVVSPPYFVTAEGVETVSQGWPVEALTNHYLGATESVLLPFTAVLILSLRHLPMSVLGSSASNLYRGEHLRARPFPTEYATIGDVAWGLRNLANTRYAVVKGRGSFFRLHPKIYTPVAGERLEGYVRQLNAEASRMLADAQKDTDLLDHDTLNEIRKHFFDLVPQAKAAHEAYRTLRRDGAGLWWTRREGWAVRSAKRKALALRRQGEREIEAILRTVMAEATCG
jgi:glycosyltransferase involved in cell wall biosynthesis